MRSLTVLADLDDVTCDLVPAWLARYNRDYADIVTREDIKSWNIPDWISSACGVKIYDYLNDPTLYDEVRPVLGSLPAIRYLRHRGHRVVFVTSSNRQQMGAKYAWLERHGYFAEVAATGFKPSEDFIVASDKSLVRGDLLIDDRPKNIETFPGSRIIYDRPWNQTTVAYAANAYRARNWSEVVQLVESCETAPNCGRAA